MNSKEAYLILEKAIEDFKYKIWKSRKPISKKEFYEKVKLKNN